MANKIKRTSFAEYHQYSNNELGDRFRKRDSGGRWRKNESPASVRRSAAARQERAHRAAVKERRTRYREAGAAVGALPGIFSSVLGVALSLCLLVQLFGILVNGNDMTNYFDGDKSGIHSVAVPGSSDRFYMFGTDTETVNIESSTGTIVPTVMATGKHFLASETLEWVQSFTEGIKDYSENPISFGAQIFWDFITGTVKKIVTGDTVDEEGNSKHNPWVVDAMKGLVDWWNSIFAKEGEK